MRLIPGQSYSLPLLVDYLRRLVSRQDARSAEFYRAISTHILDLIALRLRRPKAAAYARRDCTRSRRISRATSIKMDLSIAAVAARHAVTPRHLHKLFETEGATFSEYVLTCYLGSPIAY
jgi:AraC-like DNA-binding protein